MEHLRIDAVPAIQLPDSDIILIPDRRWDEWIKSAPKRHAQVLSEANALHSGRLVRLVKLLKMWNSNLPKSASTKSFAIETIAVRVFSETALSSLLEGAILFMDFLCSFAEANQWDWPDKFGVKFGFWTGCTVPDTAGLGGNLTKGMDELRRKAFLHQAKLSRDALVAAKEADDPDHAEQLVDKAFRIK